MSLRCFPRPVSWSVTEHPTCTQVPQVTMWQAVGGLHDCAWRCTLGGRAGCWSRLRLMWIVVAQVCKQIATMMSRAILNRVAVSNASCLLTPPARPNVHFVLSMLAVAEVACAPHHQLPLCLLAQDGAHSVCAPLQDPAACTSAVDCPSGGDAPSLVASSVQNNSLCAHSDASHYSLCGASLVRTSHSNGLVRVGAAQVRDAGG